MPHAPTSAVTKFKQCKSTMQNKLYLFEYENKSNLFISQSLWGIHMRCGNTYFDEAEIECAANYLWRVGLLQGCVDLPQGPNAHVSHNFLSFFWPSVFSFSSPVKLVFSFSYKGFKLYTINQHLIFKYSHILSTLEHRLATSDSLWMERVIKTEACLLLAVALCCALISTSLWHAFTGLLP